jgi:hypothetical protein
VVFRLCQPRIHGLPRGCILQLIRLRALSKLPWSPGCPGWCALQLCRRCVFELPRVSHPSALPAPEPQVAPLPGSSSFASPCFPRVAPASARSGCPGDGARGLPRAFHPSALPLGGFFGLPRVLAPSASPPSVSAESPRLPHLPVVPAMEPRVAPRLASFGAAGSLNCGLPRRSALPASPPDVSTGLPRLPHLLAAEGRISGLPRILLPSALPPLRPLGCPWVLQLRLGDDESLAGLELCILSLRRG